MIVDQLCRRWRYIRRAAVRCGEKIILLKQPQGNQTPLIEPTAPDEIHAAFTAHGWAQEQLTLQQHIEHSFQKHHLRDPGQVSGLDPTNVNAARVRTAIPSDDVLPGVEGSVHQNCDPLPQ